MKSRVTEEWRARYLASLEDGDDRSIAKRLLDRSHGLEDLLVHAMDEVRGGLRCRQQLLRFIAGFGDFGVQAILTLVAEEACTFKEVIPALERPGALSLLGTEKVLAFLQARDDGSEEMGKHLVRFASGSPLELPSATQVLLDRCQSPHDAVVNNATIHLVNWMRRQREDAATESDRARGAWAREVFSTYVVDRLQRGKSDDDLLCSILSGCVCYRDGRYLNRVTNCILDNSYSAEVRLWAIARYLSFFDVRGVASFSHLALHEQIGEVLTAFFERGTAEQKASTLELALGFGLHDVPYVAKWIAFAKESNESRLLHVLFDDEAVGSAPRTVGEVTTNEKSSEKRED